MKIQDTSLILVTTTIRTAAFPRWGRGRIGSLLHLIALLPLLSVLLHHYPFGIDATTKPGEVKPHKKTKRRQQLTLRRLVSATTSRQLPPLWRRLPHRVLE
jgi:hypothetical protein